MPTELTTTEPRTLFSIADDLQANIDTLAMVEARVCLTPEEVTERTRECLELQAAIERTGAELMTKTDRIAGVLRRLESETELCDAEARRLFKRSKSYEAATDWLRKYVVSVMQQQGIDRIKTTANTLSLRRTEAVVVANESALPEAFWRVRTTKEPDKTAIKAELKKGCASVPGAFLESRTSLMVR